MDALHTILFNMHILYALILGVYGAVLASRNEGLSGNFFGAMAVYTGLAGLTLIIGVLLALQGYTMERSTIYFLYMLFLVIIMPGLFSLLRGRDDRNAAIAFTVLALFNASVSISMFQRGLVAWIHP
jgi:hypothetical protein